VFCGRAVETTDQVSSGGTLRDLPVGVACTRREIDPLDRQAGPVLLSAIGCVHGQAHRPGGGGVFVPHRTSFNLPRVIRRHTPTTDTRIKAGQVIGCVPRAYTIDIRAIVTTASLQYPSPYTTILCRSVFRAPSKSKKKVKLGYIIVCALKLSLI